MILPRRELPLIIELCNIFDIEFPLEISVSCGGSGWEVVPLYFLSRFVFLLLVVGCFNREGQER